VADLIGLFDRDVFLKLACCDLWNEALRCLGVTHPYRLPSTSSAASTRKIFARRLPAAAIDAACVRVAVLVDSVPVLPVDLIQAGNAWPPLARVVADPNIAQDALLASIFFTMRGERVLVTGDKRFLTSLRRHIPLEFAAAARGIVSFEACLVAVTEQYGFNHTMARVRDVADCDGSLSLAVGHAVQPNEGEFLATLRSYDPLRY